VNRIIIYIFIVRCKKPVMGNPGKKTVFKQLSICAFFVCTPILLVSADAIAPRNDKSHYNAIVVNTWPFTEATKAGWAVLSRPDSGSALDAVVEAGSTCERLQCDRTVGFGGSPDENCETTLDAVLMDGDSLEVGGVADLRNISQAMQVARFVLEKTHHSLIAGFHATQFAISMGLEPSDLSTEESWKMCDDWKKTNCQPNFWIPTRSSCGDVGTLRPRMHSKDHGYGHHVISHDTISIVALDTMGRVASGSTTNGLSHKIPGRVGDAALSGGGSYSDSTVGGCGSTGDGDIHLRFLLCYQAVENMRMGMNPQEAAEKAIMRIISRIGKSYQGALVTLDILGNIGAAAHGWQFSYSYQNASTGGVPRVVKVKSIEWSYEIDDRSRATMVES
jgi:N4-(beta-N-acetylglucosaminyl)-L-asparaginase